MRRTFVRALSLAFTGLALSVAGGAAASCTVPDTLTNGQTADATQVMANFNALVACINTLPGGTVTTTGSPAAGALSVFSGLTSITGGNGPGASLVGACG